MIQSVLDRFELLEEVKALERTVHMHIRVVLVCHREFIYKQTSIIDYNRKS